MNEAGIKESELASSEKQEKHRAFIWFAWTVSLGVLTPWATDGILDLVRHNSASVFVSESLFVKEYGKGQVAISALVWTASTVALEWRNGKARGTHIAFLLIFMMLLIAIYFAEAMQEQAGSALIGVLTLVFAVTTGIICALIVKGEN